MCSRRMTPELNPKQELQNASENQSQALRNRSNICCDRIRSMPIYRAISDGESLGPFSILPTRRAPTNIQYVVDNLWEWKRPAHLPSRRHSFFASPRPELALQSSVGDNPRAFRVVIESGELVAQIPKSDARYIDEAKKLPRDLYELLGGQEFLSGPISKKAAIAPLFCPCLTKQEVEELFRVDVLAPHRDAVWSAIKFWDHVKLFSVNDPPPYPDGEVFFMAERWHLEPL